MSRSKNKNVYLLSVLVIISGIVGCLAMGRQIFSVFTDTYNSKNSGIPTTKPLSNFTLEEKQNFSDEMWQQYLTKNQYLVLRKKGTEFPYTGSLLDNKESGTYVTADCGIPVFRSEQKYDSKTGWPSFWAPMENSSIELIADTTEGMDRTEVIEKTCGSHLGHVFDDGPEPTGKRFCINSQALIFIPDKK